MREPSKAIWTRDPFERRNLKSPTEKVKSSRPEPGKLVVEPCRKQDHFFGGHRQGMYITKKKEWGHRKI